MPSRVPPGPSAHSIRNPGKAVIPSRKRASISDAAKASKALTAVMSKERDRRLLEDVDGFWAFRSAEISRMAEKHSVSEDKVRKLVCNTTRLKTKRAPNLRNALIHDMALKAKAAGDVKPLRELQTDLLDAVEDGETTVDPELLDDAEKKRLIDQLVAWRETQHRGARATNKAAAMDGMATARGVGDVLLDLFERTGIRAFAMFSRGNPDDSALPHCVDSDNSLDFFEEMLKVSSLDALRSYESFCCTRDNGKKERNDVVSVRKEIVVYMLDGLRRVSKDKVANMSYESFDYDIRHLKKVELLGWPEKITFQRPSKMSAKDARTIRDGLKTGTIQWHRMTKAAHAALVAEHDAEQDHTGKGAKRRAARSDKGGKHTQKNKNREDSEDEEEEESTKGSDEEEEEGEGEGEEEEEDDDDDEEAAPTTYPSRTAAASTTHIPAAPTPSPRTTAHSTARAPVAPAASPATAIAPPVSGAPTLTLRLPDLNEESFTVDGAFDMQGLDPAYLDFSNIPDIDLLAASGGFALDELTFGTNVFTPTLGSGDLVLGLDNTTFTAAVTPSFPPTWGFTTAVPAAGGEGRSVFSTVTNFPRAPAPALDAISAPTTISDGAVAQKKRQRHGDDNAGAAKKPRKGAKVTAVDDTPPRKRKVRKDKGVPKTPNDGGAAAAAAPPRQRKVRKVRKDKGMRRAPKE
ncbi:hypothetical protein DFH09DRAFT_1274476 [Mycena vulgaris]|nr:hypothetical protein DFH09DRAFT_1274476 [Mycena vulgaris]